jgi:ribosomal protein L37E
MTEPGSTTATPPPCERCGTTTFPSRRQMLRHRISEGRAIPQEGYVEVWRCPRCGREEPRPPEEAPA